MNCCLGYRLGKLNFRVNGKLMLIYVTLVHNLVLDNVSVITEIGNSFSHPSSLHSNDFTEMTAFLHVSMFVFITQVDPQLLLHSCVL